MRMKAKRLKTEEFPLTEAYLREQLELAFVNSRRVGKPSIAELGLSKFLTNANDLHESKPNK